MKTLVVTKSVDDYLKLVKKFSLPANSTFHCSSMEKAINEFGKTEIKEMNIIDLREGLSECYKTFRIKKEICDFTI